MNEKTEASYRKLAKHFYEKRLKDQPPTGRRIADALKSCASEYRPDYWRKLRNALAFDQREKGFSDSAVRIDATKNPITKDGKTGEIKQKQPRARRVSEADEKKLFDHVNKLDDPKPSAALFVAKYTGARPAEFAKIEIRDGKVFIPSAKKNRDGSRGIDRLIELPPQVVDAIGKALPYLRDDIGPTQDKIRAAGKKLWPQRKAVPSLYSFRHQMGSDLKASGLDRVQIAYVMGHQSTESVGRYGNARTARGGGKALPKPASDADLSAIRVDHSEPPSSAVADLSNARPDGLRDDGLTASPAGAVDAARRLTSSGVETNVGSVSEAIKRATNQKSGKRQGFKQDDGLSR